MMEPIGSEVRRELGRFGSAGEMADLVAVWPGAVGETLAANAWPARLGRDGTLHVAASSSTWAFELQQLESGIAGRLLEALGEAAPARLRFAPGPLPELPQPDDGTRRSPVPEPTLEQAREAAELAAPIESEELRKSVEKAARLSLARAGDGRAVW
ncbi:MAG: Dna[CI] antecedent, DciA [Gaiellaceae bacterium]|nr:Dna[CI] antecedent, DciA [Gaiellaceae bacterium]